jgi:Ni,Fe-hydrogenase I large subunit
VDYTHSNTTGYPGGAKIPGTTGLTIDKAVPANSVAIRNLQMAANYLMSHILHFYHLVALDYVDVNGTGLIPKGFLCPNYDSNYYARGIDPVLQTGGLGAPAYTVNNAPIPNPGIPAAVLGDLTPYLAGQYVRALKFRRLAHQVGAMFSGRMPHASNLAPGCVTTKAYDPTPGGADAALVQKFHELMYGGPGFNAVSGGNHPFNGLALSMSNPHPESLMGFIGKPSDFWQFARYGFSPANLPPWAVAGVPGAGGAGGIWSAGAGGHTGSTFTGTFCFDTVAAAHCFPEYFWFGSGYGRYLAWGIFEQAPPPLGPTPDHRLITRGRSHITRNPSSNPCAYQYNHRPAEHLQAAEFTTSSWYNDTTGDTVGRHMWKGKTKADTTKAGAYSFAKSPRYNNTFPDPATNTDIHELDYIPYEVGPLARMVSNAVLIGGGMGGATLGQVLAVDAGQVGLYYPGILKDVDVALCGAFGIPGGQIGVFPGRIGAGGVGVTGTENLNTHMTTLAGLGVFYLTHAIPANWATFHGDYMGGGTLDRIAARTLETYYVGAQMLNWFNSINPAQKVCETRHFNWTKTGAENKTAPAKGLGAGLTEAPRGALGHWIKIGKKNKTKFKGKVGNYQIITPTTWNINPKANGFMGPAERCMWGTPIVSQNEPLEILRVIHSFDFCCACTVHVMNVKQEKVFEATLEALP